MIGHKIKSFREKQGISQEELAQRAGVHSNTIARWERDEVNPRGTSLVKLAAGLQISPSELLSEEPGTPMAQALINRGSTRGRKARPVSTIKVPIISGIVSVCCGNGYVYTNDVNWDVEGQIDVPWAELEPYAWQVGDGGFRAMHVEGDSMEPRIHDGDIVLFGDIPISNGNFALVKYDDRLIVRSVWNDHEGHYTLRALNPLYREIEVDMEDTSKDFFILGKALRAITTTTRTLADGMI